MIEFLLLIYIVWKTQHYFFRAIQWKLITDRPKGSFALGFMHEYPENGSEKFAFFTTDCDRSALVKDALLFTLTSECCYDLLEHATGINYTTLLTMENDARCVLK
jgi:hypothetical protein